MASKFEFSSIIDLSYSILGEPFSSNEIKEIFALFDKTQKG